MNWRVTRQVFRSPYQLGAVKCRGQSTQLVKSDRDGWAERDVEALQEPYHVDRSTLKRCHCLHSGVLG